MNKNYIVDLLKRVLIFFLMIALYIFSNYPLLTFNKGDIDPVNVEMFAYFYFLLAIFIVILAKKIEKKYDKDFDNWKAFVSVSSFKWLFLLIVFLLLFRFNNFLEGFLTEIFKLDNPENQSLIEDMLETFPLKIWLYIDLIVVGPVLEEIIFRKTFMSLFFRKDKLSNHILSILISAIIFAYMHEDSFSIYLLIYTLPGISLGLIYRLTKDIRFSMIVHCLNNFMSILSAFL